MHLDDRFITSSSPNPNMHLDDRFITSYPNSEGNLPNPNITYNVASSLFDSPRWSALTMSPSAHLPCALCPVPCALTMSPSAHLPCALCHVPCALTISPTLGVFDVWDFLYKQNEPTLSVPVGETGLQCMRIEKVSVRGGLTYS